MQPPGPPPGSPPGAPPQGHNPYAPQGGGYPPQGGAPKGGQVPGQNIAIGLGVCAIAIAITMFSHGWVTASHGDTSVGLGPLGGEACEEGQCQSVGWGDMGRGTPGDLQAMGYLSLIAGLAGAGLAAACALMIFQRTPNKAPWKLARGVIGAASGFSAFLVVRIFTMEGARGLGPGWALFVGMGGLITAGILASKVQTLANVHGGGGFGPAPGANPYGPYGGAPGGAPAGAPGGNPYGAAPGGNPYAAAPQQPPQAAPSAGTAPTVASSGGGGAGAQPTYPCPRCQKSLVFVAQYQRWFCESCKQYA